MNAWFNFPTIVQWGFLFLLGAVVGGQVNRGIYRLAWFARPIGPWSEPDPKAPPRRFADRIPILGWLSLRRESSLHGDGYWIRPLFIELGLALGFVALYAWEMHGGLIPGWATAFRYPRETILSQFFLHAILIALMTVATFIDLDEKTIPDAITVTGALLMLVLATALPTAALPVANAFPPPAMDGTIDPLLFTSPNPWQVGMNGPQGLLAGMACFVGWCYALVPKLWTTRRGWGKGFQYLVASMFRTAGWWQYSVLAVIGCAAISSVWAWLGGIWWQSLLTSLVGMAFGGGMIWAVRIVGTTVLNKEAMGFGDVTLMAMVGAYMGWQASLMIFFMAPFAALFIAIAQWMFTRRRDIAFGPYLCVATLVLLIRWSHMWHGYAEGMFRLGLYIPAVLCVCLAAMAFLLLAWRFIEERILGRGD